MRRAAAIAACVAFLSLCPALCRADELDIVRTVDTVPEVCDPMWTSMMMKPDYLTYDPEGDTSRLQDNGPNMSVADELVFTHNTYLTRPIWWTNKLQQPEALKWHEFEQEDHEKYAELMDSGEQYGGSYFAYRSNSSLYGVIDLTYKEPIYKLVPISRLSNMKLPLIHMARGTSLAKAVDDLNAADIVLYGARGYPIVRQPGQIDIYEIDADRPDVSYHQQVFSTHLVCTIISKSTLARREKEREARAGATEKTAETDTAVKDGCGPYRGDLAVWAACEEKQKQERLKKVQESSHALKSSAPGRE